MSKNVTVNGDNYTGIKKVKLPITSTTNHAEFVSVEGTKQITTNGSHDVSAYATVHVRVESEAVAEGDINITANGTHDVSQYARAIVNVPQAGAGIGNLTAYQSIKVTPIANDRIEIVNPLGVIPKIIVLSCAEDSEANTQNGFIRNGLFYPAERTGCASGINSATGNTTHGGYSMAETYEGVANMAYYANHEKIKLFQYNNNIKYSTNTEYTVDIYA